MNIAAMNVRIMFQKHYTETDEIGNHINSWKNCYACWATVKSSSRVSQETEEAAQTIEQSKVEFTVRYCVKTAEINSTEYRIIFDGRIYDIDSVDIMAFRRKSLKFTAHLI
ncbi:MAG: phage head closure protein [Synergistaceae bacterium]|nr:phage head closure protein [Synergistaceae bacterium]MBQ3347852.1 phage head closure protein [Synergistaceae bacterium]